MDPRRTWSLAEAVAASIVATAVVTVASGLLSGGWVVPGAVAVVWLVAALVVVSYVRTKLLRFDRPMSYAAARTRIASAEREIWSFQISGSEFTANSVKTYADWLAADSERRLKVLFANPENSGLLRSIVRLSGLDKVSNENDALGHLREVILTSLGRYVALKAQHPGQVDVRVYDCSPPCSIHAIDPRSSARHRSIYIECYLPGLPARERPSLLLARRHAYFERYIEQSLGWFDEATSVATLELEIPPPSAPR